MAAILHHVSHFLHYHIHVDSSHILCANFYPNRIVNKDFSYCTMVHNFSSYHQYVDPSQIQYTQFHRNWPVNEDFQNGGRITPFQTFYIIPYSYGTFREPIYRISSKSAGKQRFSKWRPYYTMLNIFQYTIFVGALHTAYIPILMKIGQ